MENKKKMTPKEKGQFLIDNFKEDGDIALNDVDLSDFDGNVNISGWKVKKRLFQNFQEVGGTLYQDDQKVGGDILQCNQSSGGYIFQHNQKAKYLVILGPQPACTKEVATVITDDNKAKYIETNRKGEFEGRNPELGETCECVEPDYKAEWEKMKKELYEADKKNDALLWALEKAMEASK